MFSTPVLRDETINLLVPFQFIDRDGDTYLVRRAIYLDGAVQFICLWIDAPDGRRQQFCMGLPGGTLKNIHAVFDAAFRHNDFAPAVYEAQILLSIKPQAGDAPGAWEQRLHEYIASMADADLYKT